MTEQKPVAHVSERKKELTKELVDFMKNHKTYLLASIKNLPSKQFQDIRKQIREYAEIRVPKKSTIGFALEEIDAGAEKLKDHFKEDCAILFSDLDSFELSGILASNRSPAKARAGQEAEEDIEVEAGLTDMVPGPAISELGSVGLKTKIEDGKIKIIDNKVIVKKGEVIDVKAAGVMDKLNILPFTIGFEPLLAYDAGEKIIYTDIKIDKEGMLQNLVGDYKRALGFAINVKYTCPETISYFIGKAALEEKAFENLKPEEKKEEAKVETPVEEKAEEKLEEEKEEEQVEEKKEEVKVDTQSDKTEGEGN